MLYSILKGTGNFARKLLLPKICPVKITLEQNNRKIMKYLVNHLSLNDL